MHGFNLKEGEGVPNRDEGQRQSRHVTSALSRKGRYLPFIASL